MDAAKRELIELMVESGVLLFGDFTAKSGRKTPYFMDAGRYRTGSQIARLSRLYARAIEAEFGAGYDVLFGPAYKGIPLVVATAIALHTEHGRESAFCFNRKEAKDHGEGGVLVGHRLRDGDRVLIVEDVVTAGTSVRETIPLLRATAKVQLVGLVVAVDRMERGRTHDSTLRELAKEFGVKTHALVNIDEIVQELRGREIGGRVVLGEEEFARVAAYRAQYGG